MLLQKLLELQPDDRDLRRVLDALKAVQPETSPKRTNVIRP
jgi:hypothetical protein